jgi:hypothetical protein
MNEYYDSTDTAEFENAEFLGESPEFASPEYQEAGGWTEARRPQPVRMPPRQSSYKSRPPAGGTTNYVTEARLAAALARVDQKIGITNNAVRTVDGRVRNVISEQGKQAVALRKEITDRKKDADNLRADLKSTRELGALIGLIAPSGGTGIARLAPLLYLLPPETLSGYSSGGSSSGGLLGGGDNNLVALVAVAFAAGAFK